MAKLPTAILGASPKQDRYSFKALNMLRAHGHSVYPVHPQHDEIDGVRVFKSIADLPSSIDTVTVYLNAATSEQLADNLIRLRPRRVIFNPGAESPVLEQQLNAAGIRVENACTLVLLQTGQY